MEIEDFCYMRNGKVVKNLSMDESYLTQSLVRYHQDSGRAILLLHGFSSTPAVFRRLIPVLPPFDAIVAPLLPGHGENTQAFQSVLAHEWLDFASFWVENLQQRYTHIDIVGLSLGGLIASLLMQKYTFNHAYLLAPALTIRLNVRFVSLLSACLMKCGMKAIHNRAGNLYQPTYAELTYRYLPLHAINQICSLIQSFTFKPPTCPTEVFLGKYDKVVNSQALAQWFANQNQTNIHWLNHSAHILPLDGDMQFIARCIEKNFVKSSI